mmetsp:Transcript_20421/g.36616  ORF Transcript_20421/g.36616 Transcript_20421/m.36616 type:complete len:213 (+) Transcript_20421:44-682(+)|eukprot:CAMPEP_0197662056 /NCGR_PEP_ID=MMETSP1338-20131121/52017_1 /TAXON_ID=43686 ORGANISM="Pelagodinium beii, Strain RCC1491" /NCGR_SAMPLE_ID=MMETSP1338 /ASSEMBLY_ACC=CAM_ASM_000754 /LENGTH=212 /DNA_ID=CAMNT_0043239747 /DNA_START=44 /DNA_END=682 /DNA_ORIENTATION=-
MKTSVNIDLGGIRLNLTIQALGLQAQKDVLDCLVQAAVYSGMEQNAIDDISQTVALLREETIRSNFHKPKGVNQSKALKRMKRMNLSPVEEEDSASSSIASIGFYAGGDDGPLSSETELDQIRDCPADDSRLPTADPNEEDTGKEQSSPKRRFMSLPSMVHAFRISPWKTRVEACSGAKSDTHKVSGPVIACVGTSHASDFSSLLPQVPGSR